MKLEQRVKFPKMHNYFIINVRDATTGEILKTAKAENVVLDTMYGCIMSGRWGANTNIGYIYHMAYGDGNGSPSSTDTQLFNYKNAQVLTLNAENIVDNGNIYQLEYKAILNETTYIGGNITEIGLQTTRGILLTHAMLKDGEGNPITLGPKQSNEIWEIFSILFIERTEGMMVFPNRLSDMLKYTTPQYTTLISEQYYPTLTNVQLANIGDNQNLQNKIRTIPTRTFLAAQYNNIIPTYKHKGVDIIENIADIVAFHIQPLELVNFPNHEIFPPFHFSERPLATGDGQEVWFNLQSGYFIEDTLVVKIDGIEQTKDIDYKAFQGGSQILNLPKVTLPYNVGINCKYYQTDGNKNILRDYGLVDSESIEGGPYYLLFDFQEVIELPNIITSVASVVSVPWYYSLDGINWTGPIRVAKTNNIYHKIDDFNGISARYLWKGSTAQQLSTRIIFTRNKSLKFTTPPAVGAVISAEWSTEIPPKNPNLSYAINTSLLFDW